MTTTVGGTDDAAQADRTGEIPLNRIRVSDENPRKDYDGDVTSLKESIRNAGGTLLHAIPLRQEPDGKFTAPFGVRRLKALGEMRGENGFLQAGEYRMVDWSDDQFRLAALDENFERDDLTPAEEGKFLNALANRLERQGKKVTDEMLEQMTGLDRPRISDRRALADKFGMLPQSWQKPLNTPLNRRLGDRQEISITATHFKYARKFIKPKIDPHVLKIMERAAKDGWSAAKFKSALDALKPAAPGEQAGAYKSKERDADGTPDYERVLRGLKAAHRGTGKDDKIAEAIVGIIKLVEVLIKDERDRAKAAEAAKAAQPESEPVGTVAN